MSAHSFYSGSKADILRADFGGREFATRAREAARSANEMISVAQRILADMQLAAAVVADNGGGKDSVEMLAEKAVAALEAAIEDINSIAD